ncbi:antitoxin [Avibacterium avium]|uniref:AbrB/MazE/SpoVT family DNA-binding domain-containing protein n=2 Tax=Avibacterium avium TaxID=751 RepID=UPI003BF841EE
MMQGRLRQQGGAIILTVPNSIALQMGWQAGNVLNIETKNETVVLSSAKRQPKGRKNLAQLLEGIDSQEIEALNADVAEVMESPAQGKEVW